MPGPNYLVSSPASTTPTDFDSGAGEADGRSVFKARGTDAGR